MFEERQKHKEIQIPVIYENEEEIIRLINDSFLKDYINIDTITDITFNGTTLWIRDNVKGDYPAEKQPTKNEVFELGKAFANITGKDFNDTEVILDTETALYRINFVHPRMSPFGVSMALRVSRPKLSAQSIADFANEDVERLLSAFVSAGINILISGMTGTGKTELQRHLVKHAEGRIVLIEDTMDSHIKALYPEKDIVSWRTLTEYNRERKFDYHDGIRASLRNNPDWLIIAETRSKEAYNIVEAGLTGHYIMTTLHAESAPMIASRMLSLMGETRQINERRIGNDLIQAFPIGLQLVSEKGKNGINRFISEIVEFHDFDGNKTKYTSIYKVIKKYDPINGGYKKSFVTNKLSDRLIEKITFREKVHLIPKVFI